MTKRSTRLLVSAVLIAIGSVLALITSLFMLYSLQADYLVYQSGWQLLPDFQARIFMLVFGVSAFVLGLISVKYTLNVRKFGVSVIGATLVLAAESSFFIRILLPSGTRLDYPLSWWSIVLEYIVFPAIILATLGLVLLVSRLREFDCKKSTLLTASGAIMILCSITAALLVVISYSSYLSAFSHPFGEFRVPFCSGVVNICAFVFTLPAWILLLKQKFTAVAITFTSLVLILSLSLSFILKLMGFSNAWLGALIYGLSFEAPVIVLSATALVLAFYAKRQKNREELKSLSPSIGSPA